MKRQLRQGWPAYGCLAGLVAAGALVSGCGGKAGGPPAGFPVLAVLAPAAATNLAQEVELVGTLVARDHVRVVSEVDAVVREIAFEEGGRVEDGQKLFALDRVRLEAGLGDAEARFGLANANRVRARTLLDSRTISAQEFDQVEAGFLAAQAALTAAREDLSDATIVAPFPGLAGKRLVSVGQFVRRGDALVDVVRVDPLEVEIGVPERFTGGLRLGLPLVFASPARAGESFRGVVTYVGPSVDVSTRTLPIKATLDNADGRLRPGMFGQAVLQVGEPVAALVVPSSAITISPVGARVVVRNEKGQAELRTVEAGRYFAGRTEIRSGLVAGEQVVVEGHQKMGPGSTILVSPKSAAYGIRIEAATPQG